MRQTPYYVFDTDEFAKRAAMIRAALDCKGGRRIPLCFSIKANPFLLHRLPEGLDHVEVCSPGELEISIALGVKPESIIYSGVMKEKCDIERAVSYGAGILTCESIRHAALISEVMLECIQEGAHEAEFAETKAHVILRLTSGNQFGMSLEDIEYIISHPDEFKGIAVMGIHYYSGTQKSLRKINKDLEKIKSALTGLKEKYGFEPQLVEYGPGLCVEYFEDDWQEKEKQSLDEAAEGLREFAEEYPLGIEMGRFLAASCGKYYTQVKDLKSTGDANYAILDGGIHHLNYFGQRMAMQVPPISIYRAAEPAQQAQTFPASFLFPPQGSFPQPARSLPSKAPALQQVLLPRIFSNALYHTSGSAVKAPRKMGSPVSRSTIMYTKGRFKRTLCG